METRYDQMRAYCLVMAQSTEPLSPLDLAEGMMNLEGIPMHCAEHHFLVPAALLTAASSVGTYSIEKLDMVLTTAAARAKQILGGFCGGQGCCGAAVGCGIFAALVLDTNPKRERGWAESNQMTARCLAHVASAGGPRCCKRVTYLALEEAIQQAPELLGIVLPTSPRAVCTRVSQNAECKGTLCPFFPRRRGDAA